MNQSDAYMKVLINIDPVEKSVNYSIVYTTV